MLERQLSTQYTGNPLASAGDVNGDGYGDILVGSPTAGTLSQGHTYLIFGGADLPARVDLTASDDISGGNEGVVVFKGALTGEKMCCCWYWSTRTWYLSTVLFVSRVLRDLCRLQGLEGYAVAMHGTQICVKLRSRSSSVLRRAINQPLEIFENKPTSSAPVYSSCRCCK